MCTGGFKVSHSLEPIGIYNTTRLCKSNMQWSGRLKCGLGQLVSHIHDAFPTKRQ